MLEHTFDPITYINFLVSKICQNNKIKKNICFQFQRNLNLDVRFRKITKFDFFSVLEKKNPGEELTVEGKVRYLEHFAKTTYYLTCLNVT